MRTTSRWLRFRLSTVLVLTAILAWAMALQPFFTEELVSHYRKTYSIDEAKWYGRKFGPDIRIVNGVTGFPQGGIYNYVRGGWERKLAPAIYFPLAALAAFLGWKGFWLIREWRRTSTLK